MLLARQLTCLLHDTMRCVFLSDFAHLRIENVRLSTKKNLLTQNKRMINIDSYTCVCWFWCSFIQIIWCRQPVEFMCAYVCVWLGVTDTMVGCVCDPCACTDLDIQNHEAVGQSMGRNRRAVGMINNSVMR